MTKSQHKWIAAVLLLSGMAAMGGAALYGALFQPAGETNTERPSAEGSRRSPLVIAHRGGAGLWPENTLYAFERASALGADVLELDVRGTADGEIVVIHDATVERTTDGAGLVSELSLARLKSLDAGYRWSPVGGQNFPLRGQGITVPTLREVFATLPQMRFNIEPKQERPSLARPLCGLIREAGMSGKVLVGSFSSGIIEEFRRECPEVATSASTTEASKFLALSKAGIGGSFSPAAMRALQVPEYAGVLHVLTENFIAAAHAQNLEVHAWTVNETTDMRRLLGMGVDGIMTDYPDRLLSLLGRAPVQ